MDMLMRAAENARSGVGAVEVGAVNGPAAGAGGAAGAAGGQVVPTMLGTPLMPPRESTMTKASM